MPRLNKLLMIAVFCILNAGCTQMVTLAYKPEATGAALNAGTVGTRYGSPTKVLIQPVVESKSDLKGHLGLLIAGPQTRWLVNFNEALPDAVYSVVASTYDSVEIGNSCGDCGLIADFHDQIVEQTESGVLARHWLPKRENREYEIGNHQFPAERVAIAAGCRIGADKVRLVYQNYFAESFVASCWGKPSLAIDCEFGRCALREEYQTFNQ